MTIVIGRLGKFWAFADVANATVATAMTANDLIVISSNSLTSGAGADGLYDTDELQNSALLRGLFYNEVGLRSSSVRSSG
jgi:hypothetical protein